MRLGLLGPAAEQEANLETAARTLRERWRAERVVYLGSDQALDNLVARWAVELVGEPADEASILERTTRRCIQASPDELAAFLEAEHERRKLKIFESLPGKATRSVEIIGGKVALLIYDPSTLVEDDLLPTTLVLLGKSRKPLFKQVGRRWFLSPGSFPEAGAMLLEDSEGRVSATLFNSAMEPILVERLDFSEHVTLSAR